jgi:hypothetical protein
MGTCSRYDSARTQIVKLTDVKPCETDTLITASIGNYDYQSNLTRVSG